MNHLWSPWRGAYVDQSDKPEGCIFCNALKEEDGPHNLIITRSERGFVILNRFPYTSGHLMVVPKAHLPSLEDLDQPTTYELADLSQTALRVLRRVYSPDGFNLGVNIGRAAGAGVADHVHIHIVPRWTGDANFMTTLSETRVLPETLETTYEKVKTAWLAI